MKLNKYFLPCDTFFFATLQKTLRANGFGIFLKIWSWMFQKKVLIPFALSVLRSIHAKQNVSKGDAKSGYIMIFTLLAVAAAMMVVTYVGHRGSYYIPFSHMIFEREKAEMLAMSGVQIAIAQLAQSSDKKSEQKASSSTSNDESTGKEPSEQKSNPEKEFLARILPTLNRWQDFVLTESVDGVDGLIRICLMCEEGKINLNRIIDFKKNAFHGSEKSGWKALMQEICKSIDRIAKSGDLFAAFEKVIKEAQFPFNDATELIAKKEFNSFKDLLFYHPPTAKKQDVIYLTDIFTVWSSSNTLEPWLFSDSINGLLGLPRVEVDDTKKRKEQVEGWLKNFKERSNWQQDWQKILMPMYGKELRTLPKNIDSMLSATFAPRYFSVLVHGKVGEITQIMYAILERNKRSKDGTTEYEVVIKKLYWL
jgi:hypothetical protein